MKLTCHVECGVYNCGQADVRNTLYVCCFYVRERVCIMQTFTNLIYRSV